MGDIQLLQGDALTVLKTLPSGKFHCCVTSPPYWGLRDYGIEGQLGLEATPEEYVARLVEIFEEVKRVLRDDGVVFLNIGDSYVSGKSRYSSSPQTLSGHDRGEPTNGRKPDLYYHPILKDKDLCGIPWRVAFALQAAGWWLRSEITWCKRAPMPESVTDRPTSATEKIFLLTKAARYYYDQEAVREALSETSGAIAREKWRAKCREEGEYRPERGFPGGPQRSVAESNPAGRNMWNYWLLSPEPYKEAHFATFPTEIPRRAILAGTSARGCCPHCGAGWVRVVEKGEIVEHPARQNRTNDAKQFHADNNEYGDGGSLGRMRESTTIGWRPSCTCPEHEPIPCSVLDPFVGSGTTGAVCVELGRSFTGIDLNAEYLELARKRIVETQPGLRLAI